MPPATFQAQAPSPGPHPRPHSCHQGPVCLLNTWLQHLGHFIEAALLEGSNYRVWQVRFSAPVNNAMENTEVPSALPDVREMNRGNGKQPPRRLLPLDTNTPPGFKKDLYIFIRV